jgi:hypothetical protein
MPLASFLTWGGPPVTAYRDFRLSNAYAGVGIASPAATIAFSTQNIGWQNVASVCRFSFDLAPAYGDSSTVEPEPGLLSCRLCSCVEQTFGMRVRLNS